jgi:glycosyltransferase involved in cell wall biosynthesis
VDPGRVRFLGPQPHTAVLAAMRRCTALVAPSVWPEPFGLVALEAMAEGKPVIAARSGGLVDLVADGRTGLLVPPGDQRALGAAIRQLLEDAERRLALGRAAAAHAQLFSAENVVPRVEQVYESLLDRRRCR